MPSVGGTGGVNQRFAALVDSEPVLETQLGRNVRQTADFLVNDVLYILEVELLHVLKDAHEVAFEVRVVRHCGPDVINHFLLLCGQHSPIEVMRVDSRHENDSVSIEVVLCEIRTVPHLYLSVFIESDQGLIDRKGSKPSVKLIEANQRLTEDIQSLLMTKILDISQSIWDILSKHLDILVVGAEILLSLVISLINLDYWFVAHIPKEVSLEFLLLIEAGIVEDHMFLCNNSMLILVDLVVIVSSDEVPAEGGDGVGTVASHV